MPCSSAAYNSEDTGAGADTGKNSGTDKNGTDEGAGMDQDVDEGADVGPEQNDDDTDEHTDDVMRAVLDLSAKAALTTAVCARLTADGELSPEESPSPALAASASRSDGDVVEVGEHLEGRE